MLQVTALSITGFEKLVMDTLSHGIYMVWWLHNHKILSIARMSYVCGNRPLSEKKVSFCKYSIKFFHTMVEKQDPGHSRSSMLVVRPNLGIAHSSTTSTGVSWRGGTAQGSTVAWRTWTGVWVKSCTSPLSCKLARASPTNSINSFKAYRSLISGTIPRHPCWQMTLAHLYDALPLLSSTFEPPSATKYNWLAMPHKTQTRTPEQHYFPPKYVVMQNWACILTNHDNNTWPNHT